MEYVPSNLVNRHGCNIFQDPVHGGVQRLESGRANIVAFLFIHHSISILKTTYTCRMLALSSYTFQYIEYMTVYKFTTLAHLACS